MPSYILDMQFKIGSKKRDELKSRPNKGVILYELNKTDMNDCMQEKNTL